MAADAFIDDAFMVPVPGEAAGRKTAFSRLAVARFLPAAGNQYCPAVLGAGMTVDPQAEELVMLREPAQVARQYADASRRGGACHSHASAGGGRM